MQVEIRNAELSDLPSLEIVRRQAVEAGFENEYDRGNFADLVAQPDPHLQEWITSETHLALLVETEVTVASYGVLARREAVIRALYTTPKYQGRGCASVLLGRFEQVVRDGGESSLSVTSPNNAVEFFERFGFERTGVVTRDGLRFVVMEKSIG